MRFYKRFAKSVTGFVAGFALCMPFVFSQSVYADSWPIGQPILNFASKV